MKTVRKNPSLRYLEFIKDLKNQIELNQDVSINYLTNKHKIARGQLMNLTVLKIIKKISPRKYKWIGNMPTLKMTNEILEFQRNSKQVNKLLVKRIKPLVKTIKPSTEIKEQKQNYSFSILWGLIKIQKN